MCKGVPGPSYSPGRRQDKHSGKNGPSFDPPSPVRDEETGSEGQREFVFMEIGFDSKTVRSFYLYCIAFFESAVSRKWNIKAEKCQKVL